MPLISEIKQVWYKLKPCFSLLSKIITLRKTKQNKNKRQNENKMAEKQNGTHCLPRSELRTSSYQSRVPLKRKIRKTVSTLASKNVFWLKKWMNSGNDFQVYLPLKILI